MREVRNSSRFPISGCASSLSNSDRINNPAHPMEALSRLASCVGSLLRSAIAGLLKFLFPSWYEPDRPYHPEEHYMRGPGPKWRAKHLSNGTSTGKS